MNTYQHFKDLAATRKRKLANNTYLTIREDGGYGVKLHSTEVIIHYPDRVVLNSGAWQTVTTKARINEFSPLHLHQEKGVWFIGRNFADVVPFADGITFYDDGGIKGAGEDPKKTIKLRKNVHKFAKDYAREFGRGNVPAPNPGDCWCCCMVDKNGHNVMGGADHILSHLEDKYYVPSMLKHCHGQLSPLAEHYIYLMWGQPEPDHGHVIILCSMFQQEIALKQIEKGIRHFCYKELGLVS